MLYAAPAPCPLHQLCATRSPTCCNSPPASHAPQQEDLARQLAPRAIILSEQCAKKSRRRAGAATYSYMVVREGQEEQDGEW